ncbi:major facilitator superfamily domain-containing protein [Neurospora crassa]|nr:major facilitator superfamily domain-containing protein [Neurospora crassa]
MAAMYSSSTMATSERSRRPRLDSTLVDFSPGLDTESDPLLRSTNPFARDHDCRSHEPYRSIATANSCSFSHVSISQQSRSQPSLLQLRHRINRKTDLLLLPLLSTLYLFNGLDRGNVGNAQTQGFTADIGCEPRDLNLAISAFWVMFVACQPLSAAFGRRWGGRVWIVGIMLSWGALTLSQAFIKGRGSLLTTRLLIGAFEAGFYPTALAYLTVFYPPYDLAVRIALFYGQYAVAGAFSGAIAYAIFRIEHPTLKSWQLLFLIEGGATCLVALFAWVWLPEGPESAWFLTTEERALFRRCRVVDGVKASSEWAEEGDDEETGHGYRVNGRCHTDDETESQRMVTGGVEEEASRRFVTWREVVETVRDWKLWFLLLCNICASVPSTAFSVFLPLVVEGMGYSALQANLMSVPPFVFGALGVYLFALSSDRSQERGYHIMAGLAISAVGLAGIVFTTSSSGKYMALCILLFGSYVPPPLTAAWLSNNTRSPNKRALVLGVNGWGNLAGVIGSWVFRIGSDHDEGHGQENRGHGYREPLLITFGFVGIAIMGYWAYTEVLRWENGRMDEAEVGKIVEESSMKWDSENRCRTMDGEGKPSSRGHNL